LFSLLGASLRLAV